MENRHIKRSEKKANKGSFYGVPISEECYRELSEKLVELFPERCLLIYNRLIESQKQEASNTACTLEEIMHIFNTGKTGCESIWHSYFNIEHQEDDNH